MIFFVHLHRAISVPARRALQARQNFQPDPFLHSNDRGRHHQFRGRRAAWIASLLAVWAADAVEPERWLLEEAKVGFDGNANAAKEHKTWLRLFNVQPKSKAVAKLASVQQPQTIAEMSDIIAANTPVFFFHNQEQYFPCTVEWFLERCRLVRVAKGWKRHILEVMVDFGMLDGSILKEQQAIFSNNKKQSGQFLQLELEPSAREGQPGQLQRIPIYAHVKQTLDPLLGRRDGIEINYMKFLAYNGPYKLFHTIWVGALGAHDADWEHVTVRLTPDGKSVLGVYYSAHRHRDGCWRSANEVPISSQGRPHAYIAENGHGSYPVAGTILRLFCIINDYTSSDGRKWDPESVVLVTQNADDKLPSVVSRGNSLNGTSYPCPQMDHSSSKFPKVNRQDAPWLSYEGKWGSTVEAPQRQEWYVRAENPISRTWLQQIFFPLLPGVVSIWEPAREEVEEALNNFREGMDTGMEVFKDAAEDVQKDFERSRKVAYKRWRDLVRDFRKGSSEDD